MSRHFSAAIVAVSFVSIGTLVAAQQISAQDAVESLNLSELAAIYSDEKVTSATGGESTGQADALLIDLGVIAPNDLNDPEALAAKLTRFVADQQDRTENYIGNVSDRNIVERVMTVWDDATVIQDDDVLSLLNGLIADGYTTGYNVFDTAHSSHFDPELMLRYGHSSIGHAAQLLYLMKIEGFDPKVQFIPKSSAFIFLPEWGEPPSSVVTLDNGLMVNVMVEYNLDFEFQTAERKQAFMDLIDDYAKRDDEDETGLILDAWWQPFYRSYVPMDRYEPLVENRVRIGTYQADLVTLPEDAAAMADQIRPVAGIDAVETVDIWVNPAFFRYMSGDFR